MQSHKSAATMFYIYTTFFAVLPNKYEMSSIHYVPTMVLFYFKKLLATPGIFDKARFHLKWKHFPVTALIYYVGTYLTGPIIRLPV